MSSSSTDGSSRRGSDPDTVATGRPEPASLLYAVKRLELAIRAHLDVLLADSGVSTPQYTALTVLERTDGISASELARRSFVTPQAMADLTRQLESRDLIRRSTNPANRRERTVRLTEGGRRFLQHYAEGAGSIADEMTSGLSDGEVGLLREALGSAWSILSDTRPVGISRHRPHRAG